MSGVVGNRLRGGSGGVLGASVGAAHLVHANEEREGSERQGRDKPKHELSIARTLWSAAGYFFFGSSTGSALNPDLWVTTLAIAPGVVFDGSKVTSALPLA